MQQILLHVGVWFLITIAATLCTLVIGLTPLTHLAIRVICIRPTDQHIYIYIMYVYLIWTAHAMHKPKYYNAHEHYQQEMADCTYSAGSLQRSGFRENPTNILTSVAH